MLRPEEMCRVLIVGPKSEMKGTVRSLHKMKVLHIDDFYRDREKGVSEEFGLQIGSPLEGAEGISASIIKLRAILSRMANVPALPGSRASARADEKTIDSIEQRIAALSDEMKAADDESARISASIKEIETFGGLDLSLQNLADYRSLDVFAGFVSPKKSEADILGSVRAAAGKSRLYFWRHEGRPIALVFSEAGKKGEVIKALSKVGYAEINLSNIKTLSGTAKENLRRLEARALEIEKKRAHISRDIAEISRQWLGTIRAKEKELMSESEEAEAPLRFASTKSAFIAEGWVPQGIYDAMASELSRATGGRIYIEKSNDSHNAPVRLKNPKPAEPFEFFMNLYSLPRYTEIDPTFFMFLTFPLFFGMMLGDIGYGIVTTALFLFLRKKFGNSDMRALLNIMLFASVSSIIFGFVFGEFFGEEAILGTELPRLINRVEGMQEMLLITAGIGIVQLNLGFLLGFINKFKEHGFIHAMLEKGAWFIVEAGIALIAANYLEYASVSPNIGGVVFLAGLLMILKGEGIKGVVELPALLSNTLSYTRLMAVGLASVSLALVVNEFAKEFFHMGGVYMLIAVIILVLGHGVNLALGILGPFLHSLRLHYVEFFTKFFEGGGKKYEPFGR